MPTVKIKTSIKPESHLTIFLILLFWVAVIFLGVGLVQKPKDIKIGSGVLLGDCSQNGFVDIFDYQLLSNSFGKALGQSGYDAKCDFDGSNSITIFDYQILSNNFGKTAAINTPSPTGLTPTLSPTPIGSGMWISRTELAAIPASGAAWNNLKSAANGTWGTPDLKNQDNKYGLKVLAGALVYARTGDTALRAKTRDGIIAAKRTMDETSEWQTTNGALSLGRQLGAFVIAADLIDLKNFDTGADTEFRNYLKIIRTTNVGTHGRWKNLTYTCENSANNWGMFACPSRLAASIYLGDNNDVSRIADIMRAWMGERQYYPPGAPGTNGYFQHTAEGTSNGWWCNQSNWTAVNPSCTKLGVNIDGAIVEDASRGGICCTLQGNGNMYSWEALQGVFVTTELLYKTERFGNPFSWSNNALKRAMDFMQRTGWNITSPAPYVPWIANKRFGTSYPVTQTGSGRVMSWTDWTHQ